MAATGIALALERPGGVHTLRSRAAGIAEPLLILAQPLVLDLIS